MTTKITKLHRVPLSVGSAAVYEYTPHLIEACKREAKYADEDGNKEFNLARVVGPLDHRRIWVPRNMASSIPDDTRVRGLNVKYNSIFIPRNTEQSRCIKEAVQLLKKEESFMFEAPTGFGKTWCGADIIGKVGKKTIITVTKEDIVDQWVEAFEKVLGLKTGKNNGIGFIIGDKVDVTNQQVVIAMVNSIAKEGRYPEHIFRDFGFAVWDECHRIGADFFSQSCFRIPAMLRMGISATPDRKDGREEVLHAHIGPVRVVTTQAPMIPRIIAQESPWLIPMRTKVDKQGKVVYESEGKIAMAQLPHTAGRTGHIEKLMANFQPRNAVITKFAKQAFSVGRKVLIQSNTKDHLDTLGMLIATSGVPGYKITRYVGGLTKKERENAKDGAIILSTYQMTREATDIPDVDTLIMALPMSDVRQIVGRCIRYVPDKKEPLVLDIQDNSSSVFRGYAQSRLRWYASIGAKVEYHKPSK